jgi:Cyclic nucleotide-binding domain
MALLNAKPILAIPQPTIRVVSIDEGRTEFAATAFVDGLGASTNAQNELFDLIYRHAAASGIRLAPPKDQPLQLRGDDGTQSVRSSAERVLDIVPIFAALMLEERAAIAKNLKQLAYERGQVVVEKGTVLKSLFIVGRGVLSVAGGDERAEMEILRFGPGDHYGEIGMLTGATAGVNITALAPSIIYEISKADLVPIIESRPQIARELSHALAERQAAGRALMSSEFERSEPHLGLSNWFFERIHKFLELDASG